MIPVKQVTTEIQHLVEAFVREQQWSHKYKTVGMMLFDEQRQFLQPLIYIPCLLYTSPSPRDYAASRMPSSA
ncbi:hypothetical protein JMUB7515_28050 [Staphylococcus aureus]